MIAGTLDQASLIGGTHAFESRFARLAAEWRDQTAIFSDTRRKSMNAAYQQIIGMGPAVLPLIFRELEREPDHWFWALSAITGVDPIPPDAQGRIEVMAQAWLTWGRDHGYVTK